jgi:hypothetical protein
MMILEAVASYDLWICHAYFGMPGSGNDLYVLHRSHIFERRLNGDKPHVALSVNGNQYDIDYYLSNIIYPDWPAFVKTIRHPSESRTQHFATKQKSTGKE